MPHALMSLGAYVAAQAYAQARSAVAMATTPASRQEMESPRHFGPSVYFQMEDAFRTSVGDSPYRSSSFMHFPQAVLPQGLVDYLLNQSYLTERCYSLFRHGPASAPELYEVRPGSPTECDRSSLGGELYDAQEESFFGISWVAHVHPPQKSPLPTAEDLDAISERARLGDRQSVRHALFGFVGGEPVCTEIRALWDPVFHGLSLLHRASSPIAPEADLRIQEWLIQRGYV